jgi:geranylgeranyl reductase family protein
MTETVHNVYDVIVIGSGPAGASAAYELVSAGVKVLVLEKEKLPRYKTCGGGLVNRAVNLIPFDISEIVHRKFSSADIYDLETNLHFNVKRTTQIIQMTMRSDFDHYFILKTIERGAIVKDGSTIDEIVNDSDSIKIFAGGGTYKAKFLIAADGATGITSRIFKNGNSYNVPALELEIFGEELYSLFKDKVRFDYGVLPHGYAWVFPKAEHLSIGVAAMRKSGKSLHRYLNDYLKKLNISTDQIDRSEKHGFIIPLFSGKFKPANGRILLTGDALGLADPITAEGISYAIESGQLAARAIINGNFEVDKVIKIYLRKLKPILKELKYARILAWFVYTNTTIRKFVFKNYGSRISELLTDVIMQKKKYSELLHNPLNYLKLFRPIIFWRTK